MYRPRLSDKHLMVMDALHRAPPAGMNVARLLDEFAGEMSRSTVNNALAAFSKAGLIVRSKVEPYHYWVANDLDDDQRAWLAEASAAFEEMIGEPLAQVDHSVERPEAEVEPVRAKRSRKRVAPEVPTPTPPARPKQPSRKELRAQGLMKPFTW